MHNFGGDFEQFITSFKLLSPKGFYPNTTAGTTCYDDDSNGAPSWVVHISVCTRAPTRAIPAAYNTSKQSNDVNTYNMYNIQVLRSRSRIIISVLFSRSIISTKDLTLGSKMASMHHRLTFTSER